VKPKTDHRPQDGNVLWDKVTDYLKLGHSPELSWNIQVDESSKPEAGH